ncbi:S-adenosyl-L-methionine-dependent methyltransferase [Xylaria sp. CBS 124048]|nr:S-adenosyl-L-methionine-dependent methyltransferase [Xylaria sp. CBS 124048]
MDILDFEEEKVPPGFGMDEAFGIDELFPFGFEMEDEFIEASDFEDKFQPRPDTEEASDKASEAEVKSTPTPTPTPKLKPKPGNLVVGLPFSTLTQPASQYQGFVPPAPETNEKDAVIALIESLGPLDEDDDYIEFELDSFTVYLDSKSYPTELRPLQHLISRSAQFMFFDGVLRHGDLRFYVRKIPFRKLPLGNYGEVNHTVGDQIWILSERNEDLGKEVYYKLMAPAPEYRRFHVPYLWIANLTKHVIDYLEYLRSQKHRAILYDFKSKFSDWMLSHHQGVPEFDKWYAGNRTRDFRVAVSANIDYIFEEAYGLDSKLVSWHTFFKEVKTVDLYKPNLTAFRPSKIRHSLEDGVKIRDDSVPATVVTPYAYNLFSHMVFGKLLEPKRPSAPVKTQRVGFIKDTRALSSWPASFCSTKRSAHDRSALIASIEPGDVISTLPDDAEKTETSWKMLSSAHFEGDYHWFGLVQKVHEAPRKGRTFDVLWLYHPMDTPCSVMKYPWANELFLSDSCTCHPRIAKIEESDIIATHEVEFFGEPSSTAEYFVRQTYLSTECRWTSLRKSHLACGNELAYSEPQDHPGQYSIGDTVLVETRSMHLETFVIEGFFEKANVSLACMRRLLRRKEVDKTARSAPPNELVYSQRLDNIAVRKIDRRCHVRVFFVGEELPPPYNRDGTGDAYFITHEEIEVDGKTAYRPVQTKDLGTLRPGFNPLDNVQKLQGLDLFCGGGNLGRGIEEGSAVEMRWTNDIWGGAIHTYMANTEPGRCTPFLGSVDNLLGMALDGGKGVPAPGDVHFISAGSPCPGFSLLTLDKTTMAQRKNQSLIASFASFVDFYRPLYGVLENVPNMVNNRNFRDTCVFSQLVCAIVGLGYQVQIQFLDSWSFGSAQRRSRVFLVFTAPGLVPPKAPKASHSHPEKTSTSRLGQTACGRPFDIRKIVPTPFKFTSMRDAVGSLPDIQDGKADYCIGYPDHRLAVGFTALIRKQLQCIPTHPYGMNFSKAWWGDRNHQRVMTKSERSLFPDDGIERVKRVSKGWGRIDPNGLIGTIPTCCLPTDSRVGSVSHWEQNRPMSVLEARRAQGFPDHEILVGARKDQFRVIGNSVSRHVALVLGLAIREAWSSTLSGVDGDMRQQLRLRAKSPSLNEVLDDSSEAGEEEDVDMQVQLQVQAESHIKIDDTSTDHSDDALGGIRSPFSGVFTPATSESVEAFNGEVDRKRMLPICVEVPSAKKRRLESKEPLEIIEIDE